jgi:hypothetical protein
MNINKRSSSAGFQENVPVLPHSGALLAAGFGAAKAVTSVTYRRSVMAAQPNPAAFCRYRFDGGPKVGLRSDCFTEQQPTRLNIFFGAGGWG